MNHKFVSISKFRDSVATVKNLFKNYWAEGTTALLHADRRTDKTATAIDIAMKVADDDRKVLYIDVENNFRTHLDRIGKGSDNFLIYTPEYESPDDRRDYADIVFEAIEEAVATTSVRTFIIDSVNRIAALSFGRNASAAYIMKRIVALQKRCKLSILVIAHDTTPSSVRAIGLLADSEFSPETDDSCAVATTAPLRISVTPPAAPDFAPIPLTRQQRRALQRAAQTKSAVARM